MTGTWEDNKENGKFLMSLNGRDQLLDMEDGKIVDVSKSRIIEAESTVIRKKTTKLPKT